MNDPLYPAVVRETAAAPVSQPSIDQRQSTVSVRIIYIDRVVQRHDWGPLYGRLNECASL